MNLIQILAATEGGSPGWLLPVLLGGMVVLMIVTTVLPQRKRQKQMQEMMDKISVGDKVMTIGRMIGKITFIDTENKQLVINVGTFESPTLITVDRAAVGYVIDSVNKPAETSVSTDDTKSAETSDDTKDVSIDKEDNKDLKI